MSADREVRADFDRASIACAAPGRGAPMGAMKAWETLETALAPDGSPLTLARRGDEYAIRARGGVLMSSRAHHSEEALAREACARLGDPTRARILIGGLGFGFTLRAALDSLGPSAEVTVAEIFAPLAAWVRGPVGHLGGRPLDDPRARIEPSDVAKVIAASSRRFDAILLDVDNGPSGMAQGRNDRLYGWEGLRRAVAALTKGGILAVWSASPDEAFAARMREVGLSVEQRRARARRGGGAWHTLFLGRSR